ncbi:MAG: sulfatase-like hydrolase/transferase [Clostridia bacterium]|nr:sulfatase-like hydrolase/transferase [Clostridia bacterium]
MELIFKFLTTPNFFNLGLTFVPLYSVAAGFLFSAVCSCFSEKVNNLLARCFSFALSLIYATQVVYYWCFSKYLILYSVGVGGADQIIEEGIVDKTLITIKECIIPVLLLFLPAILSLFFVGKKRGVSFAKISVKARFGGFIGFIATHVLTTLLAILVPVTSEIYFAAFDPNLSAAYFGLLNTELQDIKYNVLGGEHPSDIEIDASSDIPTITPPTEPVKTTWQMDIDFDKLMQGETDEEVLELHKYFKNRTPTEKNSYTGMFEGYNLIYITAEGFSQYAIDKELTPTLYKMYNSGFKFNNFYTPIWGVSTSDGEYVNCTGLIPKSGVWSLYRSGEQKNNMCFTMGRQFLNAGVEKVYAYHPHTYKYYRRDVSHPNMGYDYKGIGNGLEGKIKETWPESDYEMIAATADEFISKDKRFHAYYMSVSGHLEYDFKYNAISSKNKKLVANLPYSNTAKAYIACNIELDRAMELLLSKLEAAGVADKTLIVISPDHYPYGLEDKNSEDKYHYFSELAGHTVEPNFEIYKSVLLMYSPSMKKSVEVNKYCSSMDVLPTISNLLNFEYDSRLLMGRDILSNSPAMVVFSNRSFITDEGMYNATDRIFTDFNGKKIENINLSEYKTEVNNMFLASAGILDNDYYGIVFGTRKTRLK